MNNNKLKKASAEVKEAINAHKSGSDLRESKSVLVRNIAVKANNSNILFKALSSMDEALDFVLLNFFDQNGSFKMPPIWQYKKWAKAAEVLVNVVTLLVDILIL